MKQVAIRIPQMGEGLREARLVATLKQPGDFVKRDEPIYQMETDKAIMDVESPYEGTLSEWLASIDDILPIGSKVGTMQVAAHIEEIAPSHGTEEANDSPSVEQATSINSTASTSSRRLDIPPRTRAHAKMLGVSEEQLAQIPASKSKLMPEDIDAWLASQSNSKYSEQQISSKQRVLNSRLTRGCQLVVPGNISLPCRWSKIQQLHEKIKTTGSDFQPSAFTLFAYAVAQTLKNHPIFRSTLTNDSTLRTYNHVQLGIAVSLPEDQLVIAVIEDADSLSWADFAQQMRQKINLAREGKDQANESVTISITNMRNYKVINAIPVVVPPAVGTLFLSDTYAGIPSDATELKLEQMVNIGLTFDHRISNGAGAAEFLKEIQFATENIDKLITL
jgi:pyruvate/2-oxoglutarate dehydrogenase complex dihydrolipoamide acyltransferase (E2) component